MGWGGVGWVGASTWFRFAVFSARVVPKEGVSTVSTYLSPEEDPHIGFSGPLVASVVGPLKAFTSRSLLWILLSPQVAQS